MTQQCDDNELQRVKQRLQTLERAASARAARLRLAVRSAGLVAVAGALVLPALATALDAVPNSFSDGDVISAAEMNDNFQHLVDGITALENATAHVTGDVCGQTPASDGDAGGYAAAKTACETACGGDVTAHVCSSVEMLRHAAAGNALNAEAWIATGTYGDLSGSGTVDDCQGFTASGVELGTSWRPENRVQVRFCSQSLPFACCGAE